jgi:hypothetical protein
MALTHDHAGIVVRELWPHSPTRRVVASTAGSRNAAPAADMMIDVLLQIARRYSTGSEPGTPA